MPISFIFAANKHSALEIASQIGHKMHVSKFSHATLQHMLLLVLPHYHTNEDNFMFNI